MTRVERLTTLVLLLQERRRSAEGLSDELRVSRRTVIRDVQALVAMGVPVDAINGPGGGYEIARNSTLSPLHLTWRETLLLMMSVDGLQRMTDTPFRDDLTSLTAKLRALLPEGQRARVEGMLQYVGLEVPARPQRAPHLDALLACSGGWAEVDYDGRVRNVRVDRVYADSGLWYATVVEGDRHRVLRVDRIRRVEPCAAPEDAAEPRPYDHPSHPTVRVRLTAKGARQAERDPHLGPHVRAGESTVLEFRCPPDELDWYSRYFSGFGSDAHVEGPAELLELIQSKATALLDQYAAP